MISLPLQHTVGLFVGRVLHGNPHIGSQYLGQQHQKIFASGANQAASGAGQLASGASELSSGAQQLASGTGTLYQEVQGMPDKVQQEIDAMMASYDKSDFKPVSFTSSKNTNVTLVQFVMSTDPIEAPTQEEPTVEEPEQGIWDRLLALFGLA